MERGEIITADAEAEAVVCAKIPEEKPSITTAIARNLTIFFIFSKFFWLVKILFCIRNNFIRILSVYGNSVTIRCRDKVCQSKLVTLTDVNFPVSNII
jgi:hypothetical protein